LGHCLDLSDKKWIDLARYSFDNLKKLKESEGKKLPANINPPNNLGAKDKIIRRLDCAVIQNIHQLLEINDITPFDSVRGVFFEGNPLYDGAGFHDKTHVQICIRNPNCIKGYFFPRKEIIWPSTKKEHSYREAV